MARDWMLTPWDRAHTMFTVTSLLTWSMRMLMDLKNSRPYPAGFPEGFTGYPHLLPMGLAPVARS